MCVDMAQVAVDLIAERSAGGMVEMFYCALPDTGEACPFIGTELHRCLLFPICLFPPRLSLLLVFLRIGSFSYTGRAAWDCAGVGALKHSTASSQERGKSTEIHQVRLREGANGIAETIRDGDSNQPLQ